MSRFYRVRSGWWMLLLSVPAVLLLPVWVTFPTAILGGMALVWRVVRKRSRAKQVIWNDVARLARMLSIGLAGGLSLTVALEEAQPLLGPVVGAEVESLLRTANRKGLAAGLALGAGPHTADLFLRLATAHSSGAPMRRGVDAFLERRRIEDRAQLMTRARTLPTRLIIPVALLILPGLILLILGPVIVERVSSLLTPLFGG